jgi:hypothetical protein
VYDGTGAVWQKPTRSIPVLNPMDFTTAQTAIQDKTDKIVNGIENHKTPSVHSSLSQQQQA